MTTTPLTPDERARLRALHERATPGPWGNTALDDVNPHVRSGHTKQNGYASEFIAGFENYRPGRSAEVIPNIQVIVAAVNALPRLLDALDAQDAEIARLKADLEAHARDARRDELLRITADILTHPARELIQRRLDELDPTRHGA